MSTAEPADTLILADLRAEVEAFREFKSILEAEQAALIKADASALTSLSQKKLLQVDLLNRLADERLARIKNLGLPADRNGMEKWAASAKDQAAEIWRTLLEVAGETRRMNQTNGTLIHTHLQQNQQALSVLLAAANKANLYGPDGQPENGIPGSSASRGIIGKA